MTFLALPTWGALLLLAAAGGFAAWLFFRKVRPPRVDVPSLLLWRRVFDEAHALTWWERVRRAVSLAATVLVAALLAMAVARPAPGGGAASHGRTLVVLDSSTSMLARTADGRTRWQHAVALARRLATSAGGADVSLATTAEGLVEGPTADTALVESALDRLMPVGGADVLWPHMAGADAVHLLTDGARTRPLDSSVIVHSVYEAAANVAVTALAVRPATIAGSKGEAYLEVANYATAAQPVHVTLTRGHDSLFDQTVSIGADEIVRQIVPLPDAGDPRLRAHVSADHNALAEDDDAVAWVGDAQPISVMLVTDQPAPFVPFFQYAAGVTAKAIAPAGYKPGNEDVVIFDRWLPPAAPPTPALAIAPPSSTWLGNATGIERAPRWTHPGAHDVLAGVDPLTLDITRAVQYDGGGLEAVARTDQGTPLVEVADRPDRRMVVLTFGLGDSNLPSAPSFPILMGNALEWLARPNGGEPRAPGLVKLAGSTRAIVGPDNQPVTFTRTGPAAYAHLTAPGFYDVEAGGSHMSIAVNAGNPETSNLSHTSLASAANASGGVSSGYAWWLYLAVAAMVLVTIEWWTWNRRLTV
jgi:hypothetical protein